MRNGKKKRIEIAHRHSASEARLSIRLHRCWYSTTSMQWGRSSKWLRGSKRQAAVFAHKAAVSHSVLCIIHITITMKSLLKKSHSSITTINQFRQTRGEPNWQPSWRVHTPRPCSTLKIYTLAIPKPALPWHRCSLDFWFSYQVGRPIKPSRSVRAEYAGDKRNTRTGSVCCRSNQERRQAKSGRVCAPLQATEMQS